MFLMSNQLDFKPADIKHSSLRTMAKHMRRAMLTGNHEVLKKIIHRRYYDNVLLHCDMNFLTLHVAMQTWMANRSLIFIGQILLMP